MAGRDYVQINNQLIGKTLSLSVRAPGLSLDLPSFLLRRSKHALLIQTGDLVGRPE